eukprot:TRINITY_DN895_c0_g1_i3.p1 TRINITY_DN895_c0_g1~~TRINITY_DN895_c0_g1_i3.p1  ORF type:complete len:253 (-),score=76.19 TRINITY_DN895_c0_g1_i3:615-1373(-)
MQDQTNLTQLPTLALTHILSTLDLKDVLSVSETCKHLHAVTHDSYLWNLLINREWKLEGRIPKPHVRGAKLRRDYFKKKHLLDRNWAKSNFKQVTLDGHKDQVLCVAVDGNIAVTAGSDRSVRVWNIDPQSDFDVDFELTGHTGLIQCLKLKGNTIVSGANDKTVRVWEVATDFSQATCKHVFTDLKREIWGVQFNESRIVASGSKGELCLWDAADFRLIQRLNFHRSGVRREALIFAEDYIVSGSLDSSIG